MDYSKLKIEIKEIVDIASSVPDPFKEKCFEVLLNQLLKTVTKVGEGEGMGGKLPPPPGKLPISTQLRLFMQRTGVTEHDLNSIAMVADNDVHFIREPSPPKVVDGQIQWALLLALKNCILNNEMSVDPEEVRSICQEKAYYDSPNFAANFKRPKYAELFKGTMEPQGARQGLTNEGQDQLAKLIKNLLPA